MIEADAGSTITIGGTIDNTGLVFSPIGTGTVAITGTVDGGTVDAGTGTNLVLAGSTLNNVTLSGNYQLAGNSLIYIQNDLTLDGTLTLGNSDLYGILYFVSGASQTLGGSGTVVFSGTSSDRFAGVVNRDADHRLGNHGPGPNRLRRLQPRDRRIAEQRYGCQPGDHPGRRERWNHLRRRRQHQNTGTLDATNGGTLSLQSPNFTTRRRDRGRRRQHHHDRRDHRQHRPRLSPTGTGTVAITGTIDGGTVDAGTGTNLVLAGSTLNNVTLSGNYQLAGNSFIYIENNLTLDGTLTLGEQQFLRDSVLRERPARRSAAAARWSSAERVWMTRSHRTRDADDRRGNHGPGPDRLRGLLPRDFGGSPATSASSTRAPSSRRRERRHDHRLRDGQPECGQSECLNGATLSVEGTLTNTTTVSVDSTSVLSLSGTLSGGTIATQSGADLRQYAGRSDGGRQLPGRWQQQRGG